MIAGQKVDVVALDWGVERGAEFFPVREKFIKSTGFDDGTREDMCANFGTFLDHANADLLTFLCCLLLQTTGGGQARWAGSDDDNVKLHEFAFHYISPTLGQI